MRFGIYVRNKVFVIKACRDQPNHANASFQAMILDSFFLMEEKHVIRVQNFQDH
jgi:hypothetical protein